MGRIYKRMARVEYFLLDLDICAQFPRNMFSSYIFFLSLLLFLSLVTHLDPGAKNSLHRS